jgi:catechol 2,3-dioxygenase-like lactoylglutathione lyase family enzyme
MIDHLGLNVADLVRSTEFYLKSLAPLGYAIVLEIPGEQTGQNAALGFGVPGGSPEDFQSGKPSFWIGEGDRVSGPSHVAFVARTRAAVDAFHRAALAAGGKDNGTPGLRPHYHANYYGAFVLDPDGNNIEAVCHAPS